MLTYRQLLPGEEIPEEKVTITVSKHKLETFVFCELVEGCSGCPTEKVRKCCQKIGSLAKEIKEELRRPTDEEQMAAHKAWVKDFFAKKRAKEKKAALDIT